MTITEEQAHWYQTTFDELVANVGKAVLGKREAVQGNQLAGGPQMLLRSRWAAAGEVTIVGNQAVTPQRGSAAATSHRRSG